MSNVVFFLQFLGPGGPYEAIRTFYGGKKYSLVECLLALLELDLYVQATGLTNIHWRLYIVFFVFTVCQLDCGKQLDHCRTPDREFVIDH